jgi:penicillin-binding protein 1C
MRPMDVASLYAALANDGLGGPLSLTKDTPHSERLFSAEASYLTRQALRLRDRPDFDRRRANHQATRFFWKTGTSFGNRDAWAVGAGARYTVVVWMGNLDRRQSSALVGSERCGPVLFDLLQALEREMSLDVAPPGMTPIEVCAYSGFVPGPACTERLKVEAPTHSVVTQVCPFHQIRHIDTATGLAVTPECRAGRDVVTRPFLVWPASVRRVLTPGAVAMPLAPEFAPDCAVRESSLRILSPRAGQQIRLLAGMEAERQKVPLEAEARDGRTLLHWFVDGVWLGTVPATERLWWIPEEGEHEVLVQDDHGYAQKQKIRVKTSRQADGGG